MFGRATITLGIGPHSITKWMLVSVDDYFQQLFRIAESAVHCNSLHSGVEHGSF